MNDTLISALAQVPFVLAMIYVMFRFLAYLRERDDDWQRFIETRDARQSEEHERIVQAVERLSELMLTHDALTRHTTRVESEREPHHMVKMGK